MIDFSTQVIGFDFETQGARLEYALQPWRAKNKEAWISAGAYTRGEKSTGTLYPVKESVEAVLTRAVDQNLYVCGWNITFDCSWLCAIGLTDLAFKIKWLDAMLLWRHLVVEPEGEDVPQNKRKKYRLEDAMYEFFPDDAGFKEFTNFATQDSVELQKLLFRCKEDTRFAVRLGEMFWSQLSDRQRTAALIEARCIPMVALANVAGIWSDKQKAIALQEQLEKTGLEVKSQLVQLSPEVETVNLGSPKQLASLLFDAWGLPCDRETKSGARSTDKYTLYELAFKDPRAKMLKEVREAKNNCIKYAVATQKCLEYNGDGYLRPQARIFSTYTSRMTYSSDQKRKGVRDEGIKAEAYQIGVALHQWKRGKDFRRLIRVPEGYDLLEFDFAGQEFRWMAAASQDPTMLHLCEEGEDAHGYMGAQISREDYRNLVALVKAGDSDAEYRRKLGKFANLSFQYRVSAKTALMKARTDYEMDLDLLFIKQILATYKQSFPMIEQYWRNAIYKSKMYSYAETFAGRRVQLKGTWTGRDAWPMESTAINYPIQGTGGDQKYLAMAVARNMLSKYDMRFYYELHDGIFFICPHKYTQKAAPEFLSTLSNLPYKKAWGIDLPIKFPVDGKVSSESWGDLKSL